MTPSQIIDFARTRYNAVGDNFYGDTELYNTLYLACMELALAAQCIYKRYSTTTVASQREYSLPTNLIRIERITYDGERLERIDFIEDDYITGESESTTSTGTPDSYSVWGDTLFLRPVPTVAAKTIAIYSISQPDVITSTSVLDIPTRYHLWLADFLISTMFAKDKNQTMAKYHLDLWQGHIADAIAWENKATIGDQFKVVKDVDYIGYEF